MSNSCTYINTNIPLFYEDNIVNSLSNGISPISKQDEPPYSAIADYHFPSPIIYNYEFDLLSEFLSNHDISLIQQATMANNISSIVRDDSSILQSISNKKDSNEFVDEVNGIVEDSGGVNQTVTSTPPSRSLKRRRTSNKDRHSKIRTAQGLRDRRMRLSLDVAGPFFKLQDMLGYDKGSKTVEWLLNQSKGAIDELQQMKNNNNNGSMSGITKCTASSTSDDCEGHSITVEQRRGSDCHKVKKSANACVVKDTTKPKQIRVKTTKEAREKAREKAKKRTQEKLKQSGRVDEVKQDCVYDFLASKWNPTNTCFKYQQQNFGEFFPSVENYGTSVEWNMMEGQQQ